ncbi:cytochrome P450 4F5 [Coprinopsis sp. MPI-PUGE-AT-0042]|nr:cytochrome P450 4F5 [Coprinopsis sp. MPI-PUGE-AT-0042]
MDSTKKSLESIFLTVFAPFLQTPSGGSSQANASVAFGAPLSSPTPVSDSLKSAVHTFYEAQLSPLYSSHPILFGAIALVALALLTIHLVVFRVPSNLRHLPRISPYPVIWSYIRKESVDRRIKRLVLPVAEKGHGVCLVWMLGKWGVHVVDPELVKQITHNPVQFPKKNYTDHLHFTFLSGPNVVFSNGEQWKRHSESVKAAFDREIPVWRFVGLGWDVVDMIKANCGRRSVEKTLEHAVPGGWGISRFSDLVQKYTLDVVGTTLLGHNFNALKTTEGSFVEQFNTVMSAIASPVRLVFPFLDTIFPRYEAIAQVDKLNARYEEVLEMKRGDLGVDLLSYLLEDERLSKEEAVSNLSILFSAGHDTTSGAIASCVYFLAKHPEYQEEARQEILSILEKRREALGLSNNESGRKEWMEPSYDDHKDMKYLYACIKEAIRINPPISLLPARWTEEDTILGQYLIPKHTSLVPNVYAVHNSARIWPEPSVFDPARWIPSSSGGPRFKDGKKKVFKAIHHIPFGTGPRQCVARQFSLYEQRTLLAMLLINFNWRLVEGKEELHNEFGAFGLSIPEHLDIEFEERL